MFLPIPTSQQIPSRKDLWKLRYGPNPKGMHKNWKRSTSMYHLPRSYKNRKLEDHETEEILNVNKGGLIIKVGDERVEFINANILKPPPQVQRYEPPHKKKENKSSGYERCINRRPRVPRTNMLTVIGPFKKEPPWVSDTQGHSS